MFIQLLLQVIMPIMIVIACGAFLQKKHQFDLQPLTAITMNVLLPASVFMTIYESKIELKLVLYILLFIFCFTLISIISARASMKLLRLTKEDQAVYVNSVVLMNSGNYGLPIGQFVFANQPLGVSIQVIVLLFQNIITCTYGVFNLLSSNQEKKNIWLQIIRMPIIYALIASFLINSFGWTLSEVIYEPMMIFSRAYIAVALLLLGAQLSQIKLASLFQLKIYAAVFFRLIIGPVIAFILIILLKFDGVVAQSLFIASSFPTSRNSAVFSMQYRISPTFAAQVVFVSTLISACTVSLVIYVSMILWG